MIDKTTMREGFEAQRKAGINVDWFTWQIAWHDARLSAASVDAGGMTSTERLLQGAYEQAALVNEALGIEPDDDPVEEIENLIARASMPERKAVEVTDEMVEAAYGAYLSPPADRARRDALRSVLALTTPASDSATPNETGEAES